MSGRVAAADPETDRGPFTGALVGAPAYYSGWTLPALGPLSPASAS